VPYFVPYHSPFLRIILTSPLLINISFSFNRFNEFIQAMFLSISAIQFFKLLYFGNKHLQIR
jgi:hypothetical protein